jgi:hypothetical protein
MAHPVIDVDMDADEQTRERLESSPAASPSRTFQSSQTAAGKLFLSPKGRVTYSDRFIPSRAASSRLSFSLLDRESAASEPRAPDREVGHGRQKPSLLQSSGTAVRRAACCVACENTGLGGMRGVGGQEALSTSHRAVGSPERARKASGLEGCWGRHRSQSMLCGGRNCIAPRALPDSQGASALRQRRSPSLLRRPSTAFC